MSQTQPGRERRQTIRIANAQGWLCFWCDLPIDDAAKYGDQLFLTRDHVIPKANGGRGNLKNLVACCYGCNKVKGARDSPPEKSIAIRRKQYLRENGIYCYWPHGWSREIYPNFGRDPDGNFLWAPQYGIV